MTWLLHSSAPLISHTPLVLASLAQPPKLVMKVLRMILAAAVNGSSIQDIDSPFRSISSDFDGDGLGAVGCKELLKQTQSEAQLKKADQGLDFLNTIQKKRFWGGCQRHTHTFAKQIVQSLSTVNSLSTWSHPIPDHLILCPHMSTVFFIARSMKDRRPSGCFIFSVYRGSRSSAHPKCHCYSEVKTLLHPV